MEQCMKECMRKLALWHTKTFKPIMTHEELEPIMATLGFVGLPPSSPTVHGTGATAWKEYAYWAGGWRSKSAEAVEPLPRSNPKLPYPKIDGLHIYTYRAFIDAVNFYLEMGDISDLFHIRGMPLHRIHDRSKKWRRMEEDDSIFVYREGTLDQATYNFYHFDKHNGNGSSNFIRDKGSNIPVSCIVSLEDIIP